MRALTVAPGLTLDEALYDAAADGLARYAPPEHQTLTWDQFTDAGKWWLVPSSDDDDTGVPLAYKAEYVVAQSANVTVKATIWYREDRRAGAESSPHTHPWEVMEAHPVLGGYDDAHWHRTAAGGLVAQGTKTNAAGAVNRIFARDYHEVTHIHDPGRTLSVMVCGPWLHDEQWQGIWGHLDLATGCHIPVRRDRAEQARFAARLARLNPHRRTNQ